MSTNSHPRPALHTAGSQASTSAPRVLTGADHLTSEQCVSGIRHAFGVDPSSPVRAVQPAGNLYPKSLPEERLNYTRDLSDDDEVSSPEIHKTTLAGAAKEEPAEVKKKKKGPVQKLILCTANCRYNVIKRVCRRMDFKLSDDENGDWDLFWSDVPVQPERISKL